MNAVDRDVVSSVGSAVIAGLTMLVFCTAAGMPDETALQGSVLVGAVVSAANLARHGLLLAIERALGPTAEPEELRWLRLQVATEAEAKAFWRELCHREMAETARWKEQALSERRIEAQEGGQRTCYSLT